MLFLSLCSLTISVYTSDQSPTSEELGIQKNTLQAFWHNITTPTSTTFIDDTLIDFAYYIVKQKKNDIGHVLECITHLSQAPQYITNYSPKQELRTGINQSLAKIARHFRGNAIAGAIIDDFKDQLMTHPLTGAELKDLVRVLISMKANINTTIISDDASTLLPLANDPSREPLKKCLSTCIEALFEHWTERATPDGLLIFDIKISAEAIDLPSKRAPKIPMEPTAPTQVPIDAIIPRARGTTTHASFKPYNTQKE
jgi:predicted Ser/Thr protein kinase